jgi:general secretion pathway protein H
LPREAEHQYTAGFTLLELIIVLTILGLVIGMAVPFLSRREASVALAGATIEIRAALRAARAAAIAEDRAVVFSGDAESGYRIDGRHYRPAVAAAAVSRLRVETTGGSQISFFPSGGSSGGRVVVRGPTARSEIEIDAITGHAVLLQ